MIRTGSVAAAVILVLSGLGPTWADEEELPPPPPEALEGLCHPATHPDAVERRRLLEVVGLLEERSFEALEEGLEALKAAGPREGDFDPRLDTAIDILSSVADAEEHLDAWVKARPQSALARLIRGRYRIHAAWQARGHGYADTVSAAAAVQFRRHLEDAREDFERARTLDPDEARAPAMLITVAMGLGWSEARTRELFEAAVAKDPRCLRAHDGMVTYLLPRWHGSRDALERFVEEQRAAQPDEPALLLLRAAVIRDRGHNDPGYLARPAVAAELRACYADALEAYPLWRSALEPALELAKEQGDRELELTCVRGLAEHGVVLHQHRLGELLVGMRPGLAKDPAEGVQWFCRAAAAGRNTSMHNLAMCFLQGIGVGRSPERAMLWFERAGAAGNTASLHAAGMCLLTGRGVTADPARGRPLLERAAEAGFVAAMRDLGAFLVTGGPLTPDPPEGVRWLRQAVEEGDGISAFYLGQILVRGAEGVPADRDEAVRLLRLAKAAGVRGADQVLRMLER